MSHPAVKAILKLGGAVTLSHKQDYDCEAGGLRKFGLDTLTITLATKTIGRASLNVRIFSDRALMKEYKDTENLFEKVDPSERIANLKKVLKALDGAQVPDVIEFRKNEIESEVESLWAALATGTTLIWMDDAVIRTGSETRSQDSDPLRLAYAIASGSEFVLGGPSESLLEMKGQLRRSQKQYEGALEAQARQMQKNFKTVKEIPIEVMREYHMSRGEFAVKYLEEYVAFRHKTIAALKGQ